MACNDQKNPLQHDGSSQQQRRIAALQADYILVDERDSADWIMFASRFSEYLNYYSEANIPTGNWQPFFTNDIAATIGSIAIQNIDDYRRDIKDRFDFLRSDTNDLRENLLEATLGSLFSAMLTLSIGLDNYLFRLPSDHPLNGSLQNSIQQKLKPALKKLIAYYKGGKSNNKSDGTLDDSLIIIIDKDFPNWLILGRPVYDFTHLVHTKNLSPIWLDGSNNLLDLFHSIPEDSSIYGDENALSYQRIQHAANHNLFVSLFDQFLSTYARLIQDAETALIQTLSNFSSHPPHYALFLTFLQLYRYAQDEINTITQRHLDFYYQRVLQLSPKAPEPNSVYLSLGLAKGISEFGLSQGTLFKAGKDSTGKEVSYALVNDTVFNQAQVAKLMAVYRGAEAGIGSNPPIDNIPPVNNQGRLFASPVINSADGLGAAIKTANKEWHPFVQKTFEDGNLVAIDSPLASIGFAIASSYLSLAEGDREIQVKLSLAPFSSPLPSNIHFDGYLTTAKKWLPVSPTISIETLNSGMKDAITLSILLDGNTPAITNYDVKIHGGTFKNAVPVLKIVLRNADNLPYEYDLLKYLKITHVDISVFVGVDGSTGTAIKTGARQLLLANEFGPIDPAKPFQPFGLSPKKDAAFTVGNEEFFKKPGASFQLKFKWLDLPPASKIDYDTGAEGDKTPNVSILNLANSNWSSLSTGKDLWIETSNPADSVQTENLFPDSFVSPGASSFLAYDDSYSAFSVKSTGGFIKIALEAGFGYDDYQKALANYLVQSVFNSNANNPGIAPYVPKVESISLHYQASTSENITDTTQAGFDQRTIEYYHLYPFGEAEQHRYLEPSGDLMMLPQFAHGNGVEDQQDSGELYIGLSNLQGLQGINLLVGIMEGTSDPLIVKPTNHLHWSYLSNNQWMDFDPQSITDGTAQFIQTGIISLAIPENATTDNTLLPAGYLWLRVSANTATMAVCKLIAIDTQAAVVRFSDNGNAPDFLNLPLPAGTISKLKSIQPSIKKITQPYASFGGRALEQNQDYYQRVSERLRHKDRAITIWDYEHLILEAFPELHRVKCLSHTAYEQLSNGTKRYNEVAPGHITIITIPSLDYINTVNPLRPYTNASTLLQIDAFISERISCHIQTHVVNPVFEEVVLDFQLRLMPGLDDFTYYSNQLKEEITAFLTPWAFGRSTDPAFGGKVVKSVLINFIEERSYVDFITNVKMYHRTEDDPNSLADLDEIVASTGMSILVSVPASKHMIAQIPDPAPTNTTITCIDPYAIQNIISHKPGIIQINKGNFGTLK